MASELSRYIEEELEKKGLNPDGERENQRLIRGTFDVEAGVDRLQDRMHEQRSKRKANSLKKNFCITGGIIVAVVLLLVLILNSGPPNAGLNPKVQENGTETKSNDAGEKSNLKKADGDQKDSTHQTAAAPVDGEKKKKKAPGKENTAPPDSKPVPPDNENGKDGAPNKEDSESPQKEEDAKPTTTTAPAPDAGEIPGAGGKAEPTEETLTADASVKKSHDSHEEEAPAPETVGENVASDGKPHTRGPPPPASPATKSAATPPKSPPPPPKSPPPPPKSPPSPPNSPLPPPKPKTTPSPKAAPVGTVAAPKEPGNTAAPSP